MNDKEAQISNLKPYVQMQELMVNLTKTRMANTVTEILSSKFTNNKDEVPHLISAIMYTIKIRPSQISTMAVFIKKILEYNNEYYQLTEFRMQLIKMIINVLSLPNPFPENTSVPYFLYQLINHNVLTFREFIAISSLYNPDTLISIKSKKWLFCLFGPEIEECNEDFYLSLLKLFEFKDENSFLQRVFHSYFEELDSLKENEWKKFKLRRDYEFDPYSIQSIIEHDQLTYLTHMSKGSLFDINQHIESTIFARSYYQQNRPTLLQYSALCGSVRCFRFLLQHHAKIETTDELSRPLSDFLAISGHNIITNYLFTLNIPIKSSLHLSIEFHYNELFFKLHLEKLDKMSIKDKNGYNIIQKSVISNNLRIFLHLYTTGWKINEGYVGGNTALHAAAFYGHITICKALFQLTHDMNKENNQGRRPVHHAVASGSEKLVSYFVEQKGIETNNKDKNGVTLLHVAAECGYATILNYLIAFTEIDVNAKDGKTTDSIFVLNLPARKINPKKQVEIVEKESKRYMKAQRSGVL